MVISRPLLLTLPSWSSNASHIILSNKILRRVGESRHPCQTPTVVLNQPSVLPLTRTALWALSYRFSMTHMMLELILYFLIVAYKASCHTLSKAILNKVYLLMLQIPCQRPSWTKSICWCYKYPVRGLLEQSLSADATNTLSDALLDKVYLLMLQMAFLNNVYLLMLQIPCQRPSWIKSICWCCKYPVRGLLE